MTDTPALAQCWDEVKTLRARAGLQQMALSEALRERDEARMERNALAAWKTEALAFCGDFPE